MIVRHPEVAGRSCSDCAAFLYDEATGKRVQIEKSTKDGTRKFVDVKREKGVLTPCLTSRGCPKISPIEAPRFDLSEKNIAAWNYYWKARAPLGDKLPADATTHRNMSLIHDIVSAAERKSEVRGLAYSVAGAVVSAAHEMTSGKRR